MASQGDFADRAVDGAQAQPQLRSRGAADRRHGFGQFPPAHGAPVDGEHHVPGRQPRGGRGSAVEHGADHEAAVADDEIRADARLAAL